MKSLLIYEIKKIAGRRIVGISMVCAILLMLLSVCVPLWGNYYVDGVLISSNQEQFQIDAAYKKALDGRKIDDTLIKEMQNAYSVVDVEEYRYSLKDAYQENARPYSDIFHFVRQSTGLSGTAVVKLVTDAKDMKARRMVWQEEKWKDLQLTEDEKVFWRAQEAKLENPVTYRYVEGYSVLFDIAYTLGIVGLFVIAVCMSGVFSQEHVRKTDQLILSSRYGRNHIFYMKIFAGILVSFLMIGILVATTVLFTFFIYGAQGAKAAFQLYYVGSSLAISIGEAIFIVYAMEIVAVVFMAVLVLVLSELLHNGVATLAVATALIVTPMMVSISDEYRVFSQVWSMIPGDFVGVWSIFDERMVVLFGKVFPVWQAVPVLYFLISVGLVIIAKRHFIRYQINGR